MQEGRTYDEVDTLLVVHAPNEAKQRDVRLLREAQLLLQSLLVGGLALQEVGMRVLHVAVRREEVVKLGVPGLVVDAVDDP